jgi:hypothetical protein
MLNNIFTKDYINGDVWRQFFILFSEVSAAEKHSGARTRQLASPSHPRHFSSLKNSIRFLDVCKR